MYHCSTHYNNKYEKADTTNEIEDIFLFTELFPNDQSMNETESAKELKRSLPAPYIVENKENEATKKITTEEPASKNSLGSKKHSRYQTSTNKAEKRAEHNAIERARRECLNTKFQQLARILPNLQHHRRPSKGQIVEKALDWVKQSTTKENRYQYQIMQLQNENKKLLKEINRVKEQSLKETIESPTLSSSLPTYSYKNTLFSSSFQQQIQVNSIKTERDDNHNTSITSANDTVSSSSYHNHQQNINLPLMYPIPSPKQNWNYLQHNTSSSNSFIYAPVEENLILNKSLQLPDMELIPHKGENKYMFSSEEF